MWSRSKRDHYLRLTLLFINCAACVAIVYIYLRHVGEKRKENGRITEENYVLSEKFTDEKCFPVCDSKNCVWHANMLLRNMNSEAEPCDNPHLFLCGGFEQKFSTDETGSIIKESEMHIIKILKDILESVEAGSESSYGKMRTVYDSCINYGSSDLRGVKDLKDFLNKQGLSNWPNLPPNFNFNNFSLATIFANFNVYANEGYIVLHHVAMKDNETQVDHFKVSFYLYSFISSTEIPQELARSIMKYFDLDLEDISIIVKDHELVRNSIINLYKNVEECDEDCPDVHINCSRENDDWRYVCEVTDDLLNLMNYKDRISAYSLTTSKSESIFLKKLFPVLLSLPGRSVANFLVLDFIQRYQDELGFYFRLSKLKHKHLLTRNVLKTLEYVKWKYCVRWIQNNLRYPLINEVLQQYLTNTAMQKIINFFTEYSSSIREAIEQQKWLPPELKSELDETIKNAEFNMHAVNQYLPNETHANEIYRKFHPTSGSFFNNVLQLKRSVFTINSAIKPLYQEQHDLELPSFDVNAMGAADIILDFGFLFPHFYIPNHIKLINFAALAPVFGHEFGHIIELFLEGNIDNILQEYLERKQCFIDEFSNFKYENLQENLNGSQYIYENLADSVGTTLTDKVMEKYSYSENITLPGLPFSAKKIFYIISSQMLCGKSNLEQDLLYKLHAFHAPNEFRLLSKIRNSVGFSEVFKCPVGSLVKPMTKCSLLDTDE